MASPPRSANREVLKARDPATASIGLSLDDIIQPDVAYEGDPLPLDMQSGMADRVAWGLPSFFPGNNGMRPPISYHGMSPVQTYQSELSPSTASSADLKLTESPSAASSPGITNPTEVDYTPHLLILGIPDQGTRTRVETQIRITLMLVQRTTPDPIRLTTRSGQLLPTIQDHAVKLAQWKYLKLPSYTAIKRKHRKHQRPDVVPEDTLFLECQVLRSQEPREVFICVNCSERERKRTQRKKDARLRPTDELETDASGSTANAASEDHDRRKIILFNCGEYVDFSEGDVSIPCRIACYCRHHKEKDGFRIAIQVKDHQGNLVASTLSPPIFTTDDHKAKAKPRPGYSGESSANVSRDPSFEDLSGLLERGIQSIGRHSRKSSLASQRTRSSISLPDDAMTENSSSIAKQRGKPYEQGTRRKRSGSLSRSIFSMTPLDGRSRRNSPDLPNIALPPDMVINTIPGDSYATNELAPPSPAYSITTSLHDSFSSPQTFTGASPPVDPYEQSALGMTLNPSRFQRSMPEAFRVVPSEGKMSGGYQVTILGKNFSPDTVCLFGTVEALSTQCFSDTTLICSVPPGLAPGPVPLHVKSAEFPSCPTSVSFSYMSSEQDVLEVALQIVGFKLTGQYDHASSIARQIIDANAPQPNQVPPHPTTDKPSVFSTKESASGHSASSFLES